MDTYDGSTRYQCTKDTLQETLAEYGVAVLPGVLNATDCASLASGLWDYLDLSVAR